MSKIYKQNAGHKNEFDIIADSFLHGAGLPFSDVLDARSIKKAFDDEDALFAEDKVFSTEITLWAFLAQVLRDGKEAACTSAVDNIAAYMMQTGYKPPSGDTGDYCRARAKLSLPALRRLVTESAKRMEDKCNRNWLWKGHHAKLVDGFTFTMPDTPENQAVFPQNPSQIPGVGLPIARACAVVSLATASVCDLAVGPYVGKATSELALLRDIIEVFDEGDVAVFDRFFCSYMMLGLLSLRGIDVCARVHQRRTIDFHLGTSLGKDDHLITWQRPQCPKWMTDEVYSQIPETITLRELRFEIPQSSRVESIVVVTTLTDAESYSKNDISELYGHRWNVELDIRLIKHPLSLDHLRCKTPEMILRELWVTLLAYNLVRRVIVVAAMKHDKQPRRLSFTGACQNILSSWILWSTKTITNPEAMRNAMLVQIASNEVGNRPGRMEPRVLKRRRHRYPLMQKPREVLKRELEKP